MRIILSTILLFALALTISAQRDDPSINLMETEDTWRKEAFTFPKPFAPEVNFDGVADVRFTMGWEDKTSPNFWSYAFAWKIAEKLSDEDLEKYLQFYFDGLMKVVNRDKTITITPTLALFSALNESELNKDYVGKIRLYDAFFTQEMLTLRVNGEYRYCKEEKKHLYLFRLTPQPTESPVWAHLNKTVFNDKICPH